MKSPSVGSRLLIVIVCYVLYLLYASPILSAWGYHADIWIVIVYVLSYSQGTLVGALSGLFFGVIQDVLHSSSPFHLIRLGVVGITWGMLRGGFGYSSIPSHVLAVTVTSIAVNMGVWLLHGGGSQFPDIVRSGLITGAIGLLLVTWFRPWMIGRTKATHGDLSLGRKPISSISR